MSISHSYRQGKGDIKGNYLTGFKYENLVVKKEATVWFNLLFHSVGEICFLALRRCPFVRVEQRPGDAHMQIYISHACHFQMSVSALFFSTCNRKSCWHAACLRGVIHHYRKKGITEWNIHRDFCVHYFNFWILSAIKTPVGSRNCTSF